MVARFSVAVAAADGRCCCGVERLDRVHWDSSLVSRRSYQRLAHMPAMAHANRLAGECVGFERSKKECHLGNVGQSGELLVYRLAKQDFFDDALLGDSQLFGLFGNLLLDERGQNEAGTDD